MSECRGVSSAGLEGLIQMVHPAGCTTPCSAQLGCRLEFSMKDLLKSILTVATD